MKGFSHEAGHSDGPGLLGKEVVIKIQKCLTCSLAWGATRNPKIHYEKDCKASIGLINQHLSVGVCITDTSPESPSITSGFRKGKKQPEQSFSPRPLKDALHPSQSEDG